MGEWISERGMSACALGGLSGAGSLEGEGGRGKGRGNMEVRGHSRAGDERVCFNDEDG